METRKGSLFVPIAVFGLLVASAFALLTVSSPHGIVSAGAQVKSASGTDSDPRMKGAYRFEDGGWIYVHLEGTPAQVGFQHGSLLAKEIEIAFKAVRLDSTHRTKRDWKFFRATAHNILWPKIDDEYKEELNGIVAGVKSKGIQMDIDDVVAMNAFEEVPDYYVPWLNRQQKTAHAPKLVSPGNCSAFVATGSYTKDGKIVIAHNAWTSYWSGENWRIIFDIVPARGHRMIMDGYPGVITSDDDFGVNDAGLMITETTITQFEGYDPAGKPEFVRSRKAMQYASSIDEYVQIMLDGNNGGYANDWLIGDRKTGEIAQFEIGLKNHKLWRSKDGYFVGSNFPSDPKLLREETKFDAKNSGSSPNARRARWEQLMKQDKGKIDAAWAEKAMSDHHDVVQKKEVAGERTLCGHVDATTRGVPEWEWGANYPGGAVQGKVMDDAMATSLTLRARFGHPCGADFIAAPFLKAHPEYSWQAPILKDMKAGPWTTFKAGQKPAK
jgi:phospholipase B-like protein